MVVEFVVVVEMGGWLICSGRVGQLVEFVVMRLYS